MPRISRLVLAVVLLSAPARANADVVLDWNSIAVSTLPQNPFAASRIAAIMHLAVFEAVNAVSPHYEPYLGTIVAAEGASAEAAAIAAAHKVLVHYVPSAATALDAARASSLLAISDEQAKKAGIAVGEAAAAAMIPLRAADGAGSVGFYSPASLDPGEWQVTPSSIPPCPPQGGVLLHWGSVIPFGIQSASQYRPEAPPALTTGRYWRDFAEVKEVGAAGSTTRSADRTTVARFYNSVLAVAAWNSVARQLSEAQGTTLTENARAFALINMAIADALIAVMETKYYYRYWRPETAIHAADADGNSKTDSDSAFTPLIPAPCFPSYPSAHASASYAARRVVEKTWGNTGHDLILTSQTGVVLKYTRLDQITADIDDARVYGGIHFRFDQEAGALQGLWIGTHLLTHQLRELPAAQR